MIDLAQAQPETVYLAEDEAWIYLQATTMAVWSPEGETPIARVDPGHTKVGFYGTLNLLTGEEIVTHTEGFNSQPTATHLQSILDTLPDNPIVLFWDRAKWHRGQAVRELLAANPRLAHQRYALLECPCLGRPLRYAAGCYGVSVSFR